MNRVGLLKGEGGHSMVRYAGHTTEGSLSGLGHVFLGARLPTKYGKGTGHIRVKIFMLDDE